VSRKTLRNLMISAAILTVGLVVTGALVKSRAKPARTPAPAPRPLVTAYTVPETVDPVQVTGFGTVKAKQIVSLVPQVNGEIRSKSLAFEPGSFVSAGDTLLEIDDTDYVLTLENARASLAQAKYNLALAREEAAVALREWDRLQDHDTLNATPLVRHEPQVHLAEANLTAATAAVRLALVNLDRCTIRAPFDGQVLAADTDAGQYLRAGNAIGTIIATAMAEVTVAMPDADLAWISMGSPVTASARVAGADARWPGTAVRPGGAVDPRSRLVPVVVEIPNPYHSDGTRPALLEGLFVQVTFSTQPPAGMVVIPRAALRPDAKVWVVTPDGLLDLRTVTVARAGIDRAVIGAGLQPGERVCTSNLQYVTQGMPVRIATTARGDDQ